MSESILSAAEIRALLIRGHIPADAVFDRLMGSESAAASFQHWTPLSICARVANWMNEFNIHSVVDVGSGSGKFCVATALLSQGSFYGLEQRKHLVFEARALAKTFSLDSLTEFAEGTLQSALLPPCDAYYFYNPFGENLFEPEEGLHLDQSVPLSWDTFEQDVAQAYDLLTLAPVGTFVIEYNGFGGELPPHYVPLRAHRGHSSVLRLWQKRALRGGGS